MVISCIRSYLEKALFKAVVPFLNMFYAIANIRLKTWIKVENIKVIVKCCSYNLMLKNV